MRISLRVWRRDEVLDCGECVGGGSERGGGIGSRGVIVSNRWSWRCVLWEIKELVPLPGGGCGDDEDGTLLGVDMRKMLQN